MSSSHGRPVATSATPPQRSTTFSPRWYAENAAPTSSPSAKFFSNWSRTFSNPAAVYPSIAMRCSPRGGDGCRASHARLGQLPSRPVSTLPPTTLDDDPTARATLASWLQARLGADRVDGDRPGAAPQRLLGRDGGRRRPRWTAGRPGSCSAVRRPTRRSTRSRAGLGVEVDIQYRVMEALAAHSDVPVAPLVGYEADAAVLGAPFFVMGFVDGEVPIESPPYPRRRLLHGGGAGRAAHARRVGPRGARRGPHGRLARGRPRLAGPGRRRRRAPRSSSTLWRPYADAELDGRRIRELDDAFAWIGDRPARATSRSGSAGATAAPGNIIFGQDFRPLCLTDFEAASIALARPGPRLVADVRPHDARARGHGSRRPDGDPTRAEQARVYAELAGRTPEHLVLHEVFAGARYAGDRRPRDEPPGRPGRPAGGPDDLAREPGRRVPRSCSRSSTGERQRWCSTRRPPRRRVPPADERRPVLDRDLLVHLHRARAPAVRRSSTRSSARTRGSRPAAPTSGTTERRPAVELPVRQELLAPADPRPAALRHHAAQRHPLPLRSSRAPLRGRLRRPRRRRAARRRSRSPRSRRPELPRRVATSTSPAATRARSCCDGEEIPVDSFGFRDRSWGPRVAVRRDLHGSGADNGGYSYATASERRRASTRSRWTGARAAAPSTATSSATAPGRRWPRGCERSSSATRRGSRCGSASPGPDPLDLHQHRRPLPGADARPEPRRRLAQDRRRGGSAAGSARS